MSDDPRFFPGDTPSTAWHRLVAAALEDVCGYPGGSLAASVLNTAIERWLTEPGLLVDLLAEAGVDHWLFASFAARGARIAELEEQVQELKWEVQDAGYWVVES